MAADVQIPVSLISEYLAKAMAISPLSTADFIIDCNRLLFTLAILLPAPLFRLIRDCASSGDLEDCFTAIVHTRAAIGSPGSLVPETDAAAHGLPPAAVLH
jgi:hypothetical protein